MTAPSSFLRTDSHLIGLSTSICVTFQRMAGFHEIASSTPRAADGVITSYETRSTFISGLVKQAFLPHTFNRKSLLLIGESLMCPPFIYKISPCPSLPKRGHVA